MYCRNCGTELEPTARFCHNCGMSVSDDPTPACGSPGAAAYEKSEFTAMVLSAVVVGLGQIYMDKVGRGIKMLVLMVLLCVLSGLLFMLTSGLWVAVLSLPVLWFYNIYDAYRICKEYNAAVRLNGTPPW